MSYLLEHFDRENAFANYAYNIYRDDLLVLLTLFDEQGHSGSSAAFTTAQLRRYRQERFAQYGGTYLEFKVDVNIKSIFEQLDDWLMNRVGLDNAYFFELIDLFIALTSHKPLSPLTGEDDEWSKVSDTMYQNKRMSSIFKDTAQGVVTWHDGSVLMEFYDDYSGIGTYHSSRAPSYNVTFPFDASAHQPNYYLVKPGTVDEFLVSGPYEDIQDELEFYRRYYRRNWMLGLDPTGTYYRWEAIDRISYGELCAALVHFDNLIKPMIDSDGFDLYRLTDSQRSLFEGSELMVVSQKTQALLYHAALRYHELDPIQRQQLFGVRTRIEVFYKPDQHYQRYIPIHFRDNPSDESSQGPELGIVYLDSQDRPLAPEQARKYLFEQCKVKRLEFKAGKTDPIATPTHLTEKHYLSAWVTPYLREAGDESAAFELLPSRYEHMVDYMITQLTK